MIHEYILQCLIDSVIGHAVPLCCIFRVYEVERTGDQEFDVDF